MAAKFLAIDPGVGGALAVLTCDGVHEPIHADFFDLPTEQRKLASGSKRRRINGASLLRLMIEQLPQRHDEVTFLGLEAIHAVPFNGSVGVFSQGQTLGAIQAVVDILCDERPGLQLQMIAPAAWKKHHSLTKTTKEQSRQLANRLFNNPASLRRKGDHDRAEAGLMALYLRDQVEERLAEP